MKSPRFEYLALNGKLYCKVDADIYSEGSRCYYVDEQGVKRVSYVMEMDGKLRICTAQPIEELHQLELDLFTLPDSTSTLLYEDDAAHCQGVLRLVKLRLLLD